MKTLRAFEYQDPFWVAAHREALQQKQKAACGDCVYHLLMPWKKDFIHRCELKKYYGKRCLNYRKKMKS